MMVGVVFVYVEFVKNSNKLLSSENIETEYKKIAFLNRTGIKNHLSPGLGGWVRSVGMDSRNNARIVAKYFCSDVCPQYGSFGLYYEGIYNSEKCSELGGRDVLDAAWGAYVGCKPITGSDMKY